MSPKRNNFNEGRNSAWLAQATHCVNRVQAYSARYMDRPMNRRGGAEARNMTLCSELTGQEDGRQMTQDWGR